MTDPFAKIKGASSTGAIHDETAHWPIVVLSCKTCSGPIQRALKVGAWEHADDEIVMRGTVLISTSKYDHSAEPDVIDAEPID